MSLHLQSLHYLSTTSMESIVGIVKWLNFHSDSKNFHHIWKSTKNSVVKWGSSAGDVSWLSLCVQQFSFSEFALRLNALDLVPAS